MDSEITRSTVIAENYAPERAIIIASFRGVEFTLQASHTALDSPNGQYASNARVLDGIEATGGDSGVLRALQDLRRQVFRTFEEHMRALAPADQELRTLHDAADCVKFRLSTTSNGRIDVTEQAHGPSLNLVPVSRFPALEIVDDVTYIQANEVSFFNREKPMSTLLGAARVTNGSEASGTRTFLKPAENGKSAGFQRALDVYLKISRYADEQQRRRARIPRLIAVVPSPSGEEILGFLTEWVDGHVLANVESQRRKEYTLTWKDQVGQSIAFLHTMGVVWGDINAHNILIDQQDQAWIVDFSGGLTTTAELQPSAENMKREVKVVEDLFDDANQL